MTNYFVRVEAEPSESQINVELGKHGIQNIKIYHNMYQWEIEAAFVNWTARLENPNQCTSKNFCNYILSKNSMTGHVAATTEDNLGMIINNAFENDLTW